MIANAAAQNSLVKRPRRCIFVAPLPSRRAAPATIPSRAGSGSSWPAGSRSWHHVIEYLQLIQVQAVPIRALRLCQHDAFRRQWLRLAEQSATEQELVTTAAVPCLDRRLEGRELLAYRLLVADVSSPAAPWG